MDRGSVEHCDNRNESVFIGIFASLESNKCMANRALHRCLYSEGSQNQFMVV